MVVQLQRRADLFHHAALQHHDLIGHGHRLDLIVGHVNHGGVEIAVHPGDLDAHLHPQRRVEIGERFVEQEHLGVADDGAADGDPLALAARQGFRLAIQQRVELEDAGRLVDLAVDFRFRHLGQLQTEPHVVAHRHVRIERVGLEHHRDAALGGGQVVDPPAVDAQLAVRDAFQTGDHPQQGRFAAAGRTDENHEFLVVDVEVNAFDHVDRPKGFLDIAQ